MKVEIDQIIALIIVLGSLVLIFTGIDGEVKSILLVAAGWAFGSGYQKRRS